MRAILPFIFFLTVLPLHAADIRNVDFWNRTHDTSCITKNGRHVLKNGEYRSTDDDAVFLIHGVTYGDLTKDGQMDAAVITYCMPGGGPRFSDVHLYTMNGNVLREIGEIQGGDRAYSGIASVKLNSGSAAVAKFGTEDGPSCCPQFLELYTYEWTGNALKESENIREAKYTEPDLKTVEEVRFTKGASSTLIESTVTDYRTYTLRARQGQHLDLELTSLDNMNDALDIRVESSAAEILGPATVRVPFVRRWSGPLPASGLYKIVVISYNGSTPFKLKVSVR